MEDWNTDGDHHNCLVDEDWSADVDDCGGSMEEEGEVGGEAGQQAGEQHHLRHLLRLVGQHLVHKQ